MTALVAFPVLFASARLHIDKGKRWNAIEHLLLHAVSAEPKSATTLARDARLPRRVVIEVMIRLMRVGWVELVGDKAGVGFRATVPGHRVVQYESLPAVTRPLSRRGSFAIDQVSGAVFRARELTLYSQGRLEQIRASTPVTVLTPQIAIPRPQIDEIISTLLDDDEYCRGVDASGGKLIERFAIVRVTGQAVDGLPARAPAILKEQILAAVSPSIGTGTAAAQARSIEDAKDLHTWDIVFNHQDLILGGPAHRRTFENLVKRARSRIVIHSTFIYPDKFALVLPLLKDAARRGVRIDVLWGKSPEPGSANVTNKDLESCRSFLDDELLRDRIHIHHFTTHSHSKILLGDNGRGQLVAVVGSCNWFSTGFESFDVSAHFMDPVMVGDIAGKLASMIVSGSGHWTELSRDLGALGATLRKASRPSGARAKVRTVLGGEHDLYVRMARDTATRRIVVASHRFSDTAETAVLIPARAAIDAHNIDVTLLYGLTTGAQDGRIAQTLAAKATEHGIRLHQIHEPRLHAKFLAWDDNNVVVTSQNWLSADPPDSSPYSEIGVFISGPNVARELLDLTKLALERALPWHQSL